jgi:peptidoglycan/LPS O-acetylase OafA/YrhL
MNTKPANIPNLTPLRGIAAIMVAIYHFNGVVANFVNPRHTFLIQKCYLMVDLFIVMSGFIMLHVYGHQFRHAIGKKDFFSFMGARFARVYPLHFVTLAISVATFYGLHQPPSPINNPAAIPTHLLLLHSFGIHTIFTWNVPSWSISAEWWAYVLFPFLGIVLGKAKNNGAIILSAISLVIYISIVYFLPRPNPMVPGLYMPHNLDITYDYGYLRGLAGFMAGMVTYIAFQQKRGAGFFNNDFVALASIVAPVLLLHFGANDLLLIPSFMLLVLAIANNQKGIHKILLLKPLQYVGNISYSIYLVHGLLLFSLAVPMVQQLGYVYMGPGSLNIPFFTGAWVCAIFLVAVLLFSTISYYFIDKPKAKKYSIINT